MESTTLLVFADDWGRHPSSCQHLMGQLVGRYSVVWVNTIGMRRPRLNFSTVLRGMEKVGQWLWKPRPVEAGPSNPRVLNPRMWPWITSQFDRWLNRKLLLRQLTPVVETAPGPVIGITVLPIVADLMGALPVRRWIYYCVDDFGQWPGLQQSALRAMEEQLVTRADAIIAVSENLRERLAGMGRSSQLLTHGVDLPFWAGNGHTLHIPQLEGLERPLVVFWGVLDRRMDLELIRRLSADLTRGTILLVGPEVDPDPELVRIPRVVRLEPLPYEQLPYLGRAAGALVMPYADLPVTRAIQPLKLKEYLATGRPTIVRDLPANRFWADCLDLADSPEAFSVAVRRRLETGLPDEQRAARARLASEGWTEKAAAFEKWALHA